MILSGLHSSDFYWVFKDLGFYTDLTFSMAMIGLVLMIITKEIRFSYSTSMTPNIYFITLVLRWLQSITTAVLIYALYWSYQIEWRFLQACHKL